MQRRKIQHRNVTKKDATCVLSVHLKKRKMHHRDAEMYCQFISPIFMLLGRARVVAVNRRRNTERDVVKKIAKRFLILSAPLLLLLVLPLLLPHLLLLLLVPLVISSDRDCQWDFITYRLLVTLYLSTTQSLTLTFSQKFSKYTSSNLCNK